MLGPVLRHIGAILGAALLLAGVALWNGYPMVYFDSEDYVNMAFTWDIIIYRTMPYALVVWPATVFSTLWAVVAVQATASALVLHEAVCAFFPNNPLRWLLGLTAGLVLITGLPWYVAQVMADVFAGLTILGIAVLAFGERLPGWRRLGLAALVALSIMVHMSHVAVAAGLLLCLVALWLLSRLLHSVPRPRMGMAALAVVAGIGGVPMVHWAATGSPVLSPSGRVLQLALFVQHGLVDRFLDDVCPRKRLKLCPYDDDLPETADAFLWAPWASPFKKLGGWIGMMDEADYIVAGILRRYPLEVARLSLDAGLEQIAMIALGEGLTPKLRINWAGEFIDTLVHRFPFELRAYVNARQNIPPGISFEPINDVEEPLAVVALAVAGGVLAFAWTRGDRPAAGLAVLVFLGMFGNALVCGAVSNPHHRYQNRIAWLPFVVVAAGVARLQSLSGSSRPIQSATAEGKAEKVLTTA